MYFLEKVFSDYDLSRKKDPASCRLIPAAKSRLRRELLKSKKSC